MSPGSYNTTPISKQTPNIPSGCINSHIDDSINRFDEDLLN